MEHSNFQALDERAIKCELGESVRRIVSFEVVEETASTNGRLLDKADAAVGFHVCLAESQTAGRGRRGRKVWHSPKSGNLYLSLMYCSAVPSPQSTWLALSVSTEVVSALADIGVSGLGVKWPNDIYYKHNGAQGKLGGVLVESKGVRCVVGLGLNVHLRADDRQASETAETAETAETTKTTWVALDEIRREGFDRQRLAALMITAIMRAIDRVERSPTEALMRHWQQYDLLAGRKITVVVGGDVLSGVVRGVDERGGLRVEHGGRGGSKLRVYYSDDVSIRW